MVHFIFVYLHAKFNVLSVLQEMVKPMVLAVVSTFMPTNGILCTVFNLLLNDTFATSNISENCEYIIFNT